MAQSPYPLRVLPAAPCVKRCRVEGGGRCGAVAGVAAHFEVEACDELGNRCSVMQHSMLVFLSHSVLRLCSPGRQPTPHSPPHGCIATALRPQVVWRR